MKRKQSTLTSYLSPSSSSSSSSTPRGKQEEEEPTTKRAKKTAAGGAFDYTLDFKSIDMRQHPELYRVGRGEQGVLSVEPYKSEILPHWRFRTPDVAAASADAILALYRDYKQRDDFIGMDMSRKFLQMGFTRSRRYANHRSGRKYSSKDKEGGEMMTEAEKDEVMANSAFKDVRNRRHTIKTRTKEVLPLDHDPIKAQSAEEFRQRLDEVKADPDYARMKAEHQRKYEGKHDATKPKPKARTRTESATPAVKR